LVFKRRDKRSWLRVGLESLWPRGGWGRAAQYVRHRVRRLPDTPDRIARGLFAGVFTTFTPFYGVHFVVAAIVARCVRGNMLAALLGTFFGNPVTYFPIGVISLSTGQFFLGTASDTEVNRSLLGKFVDASSDLTHNFYAMFNDQNADWHGLLQFYDDVFFPYLIGGILPGLVTATIVYYISLPLITAYQNRRKGMIKAKLAELGRKAAKKSKAKRAD
jgi:uncharacterized protein (DUF2062 family)